MLSSHIFLSLSSVTYRKGFPTKILYVSFVYPITATFSDHSRSPDFTIITILRDLYKSQVRRYVAS